MQPSFIQRATRGEVSAQVETNRAEIAIYIPPYPAWSPCTVPRVVGRRLATSPGALLSIVVTDT